jgi:hypothetical protein
MNRGFSRWANWSLLFAIVGWAIASIIALASRCSSPHPWSFVSGQCDNQVRSRRKICGTLFIQADH